MGKKGNSEKKENNQETQWVFKSHPFTNLLIIVGIASSIAGVYFKIHNLSSSGVTMGRYGSPYGTGTLNGDGILICGIICFLFGILIAFQKKKH